MTEFQWHPHLAHVLLLLRGLLSASQGPLRGAAPEAAVAALDGDEVLPATWRRWPKRLASLWG